MNNKFSLVLSIIGGSLNFYSAYIVNQSNQQTLQANMSNTSDMTSSWALLLLILGITVMSTGILNYKMLIHNKILSKYSMIIYGIIMEISGFLMVFDVTPIMMQGKTLGILMIIIGCLMSSSLWVGKHLKSPSTTM